jgi:hypothetical protein
LAPKKPCKNTTTFPLPSSVKETLILLNLMGFRFISLCHSERSRGILLFMY